jgi:hypothetical protein
MTYSVMSKPNRVSLLPGFGTRLSTLNLSFLQPFISMRGKL